MRILTFDIGGTTIKYALTDEKFVLKEQKEIPTEAKKGGQHIINKVMDIISEYKDIDRIGICTAGQVDSDKGIIVYSTGNIPYYTGMMVKAIIEDKFNIPTFVENDVNAVAIAEAKFGSAKGFNDFICITYGTGIGGALYLDGKLYKGSTSSAAEIGHMITHAGGKDCTCGGSGCYEAYASTKALTNSVKQVTGKTLNGREIFDETNFNNPEIRFEIDKWIDEIIVGLVNIIYTFNPPLIVLGGGIMSEPYIIDLIDRKLYNRLMECYKQVNIVRALHKNDAGMLGVAYLASKLKNL